MIAGYKAPRDIDITVKLPKTSTEKIQNTCCAKKNGPVTSAESTRLNNSARRTSRPPDRELCEASYKRSVPPFWPLAKALNRPDAATTWMECRPGPLRTRIRRSLADPEGFWGEAAKDIDWYQAPTTALDASNAPFYHWFPTGS